MSPLNKLKLVPYSPSVSKPPSALKLCDLIEREASIVSAYHLGDIPRYVSALASDLASMEGDFQPACQLAMETRAIATARDTARAHFCTILRIPDFKELSVQRRWARVSRLMLELDLLCLWLQDIQGRLKAGDLCTPLLQGELLFQHQLHLLQTSDGSMGVRAVAPV